MMDTAATGLIGIAALLVFAVLFSANRRAIRPFVVLRAFALQFAVAVLVLRLPAGQAGLQTLSDQVLVLLGYTQFGVDMVFGDLQPPPDEVSFFISVLPIIVFFSSLMAVLYHLQIMQRVVEIGGFILRRLVGLRPLESLNAIANIFISQAESPLTLRPYLKGATQAQIFAIMVSGMASVSGTVLAAYASMGIPVEQLVAASFMSAPGGLLMGHLFFPGQRPGQDEDTPSAEVTAPSLGGGSEPDEKSRYANVIMAAAVGAESGLVLAAKIGAMLLAFVALIALANGIVGWIGGLFGISDLSIQMILGFIFAPVMIAVGAAPGEAIAAGGIFGEKLIANEFIAYLSLSEQLDTFSPKTALVVTFALCGFANVSSIAILLGGLGTLAPHYRDTIARMGIRAVAAASFSNLMSAAIAGILFSL
ncbi:MAG: nucleoside transporter C-terminal domain-containing protein [Pseudomonadota bacterium]